MTKPTIDTILVILAITGSVAGGCIYISHQVERVAVLETKVDLLTKSTERLMDGIGGLNGKVDTIIISQHDIVNKLGIRPFMGTSLVETNNSL